MEYKPIILSEDLTAVASGKALEYRDSPKAFLNFKEEPEEPKFRFIILKHDLTHQIIKNFALTFSQKTLMLARKKKQTLSPQDWLVGHISEATELD